MVGCLKAHKRWKGGVWMPVPAGSMRGNNTMCTRAMAQKACHAPEAAPPGAAPGCPPAEPALPRCRALQRGGPPPAGQPRHPPAGRQLGEGAGGQAWVIRCAWHERRRLWLGILAVDVARPAGGLSSPPPRTDSAAPAQHSTSAQPASPPTHPRRRQQLLQGLNLGVCRLCAGSGGAGLPLHLVQLMQQALQEGEARTGGDAERDRRLRCGGMPDRVPPGQRD